MKILESSALFMGSKLYVKRVKFVNIFSAPLKYYLTPARQLSTLFDQLSLLNVLSHDKSFSIVEHVLL